MILQILSILDLFALIIILVLHFTEIGFALPVVFASGYLIVKGLIFLDDFFSFPDILTGLYIILLASGLQFWITAFFTIYLGYKVILGTLYA